jgi:hypothetical protein
VRSSMRCRADHPQQRHLQRLRGRHSAVQHHVMLLSKGRSYHCCATADAVGHQQPASRQASDNQQGLRCWHHGLWHLLCAAALPYRQLMLHDQLSKGRR